MTSHAAVVARGMGRPCVAGAGAITVDYAAAKLTVGSVTVSEGQILTIDGSSGEVIVGEVPTVPPQLSGSFGTIMEWADEFRDMKALWLSREQVQDSVSTCLGTDFLREGLSQSPRCEPTRRLPQMLDRPKSSAPRASAWSERSTCSSRGSAL